MDHWLYTSCMAGIFVVIHDAGKRWLRCIVATIDSNSCFYATSSYVSDTSTQFNYLSPLSDFYRAPSGTVHFLTIVAVIEWKWNHEPADELFITAYACPDWLANCTLLGYSINTTVKLATKFMKLGECQNCFHKHVSYCVSCDEFCQVQYITVIGSVTVLSWMCLFQCSLILVRTTTHKVFVFKCVSSCPANLSYFIKYSVTNIYLALLFIHEHIPLKVQTVY